MGNIWKMFNYDGTVLKSSAPEKFEGVCDVAWINDVTFVAQYVVRPL